MGVHSVGVSGRVLPVFAVDKPPSLICREPMTPASYRDSQHQCRPFAVNTMLPYMLYPSHPNE